MDQLCLQCLLIRHVLDQHHDAVVVRGGGGGGRNAGSVDTDRTGRRPEHHRLHAISLARRDEQLDQSGGGAEQRLAQVAADHGRDRRAEHGRERAVGAADAATVVHHGDPLRQRVERGLPLLFGMLYHLEEPGVGDHDRGMRGHGREQPHILGGERAVPGIRDDQRADDDPVRAQGHRSGRVHRHVLQEARRFAAGAANELEPLAVQRARDEAGIGGSHGTPGESRQRPLGGGDAEGALAPPFSLGRERDQRSLRVEEPHRIAHHLLHDAVEL